MKGIFYNLVLIFSVLSFGTTEVQAQAKRSQPCEGCTIQQMQYTANASAELGQTIYVFNLSTGIVLHYLIEDAGTIPPLHSQTAGQTTAIEIGVEPAIADHFEALVELYDLNGGSLDIEYELNSSSLASLNGKSGDLPLSAYETLNNSAKRNNLMTHMHSTFPSFVAGFNQAFLIVNPIAWFNSDATKVTVTVEFPDSTSVKVRYDYEASEWGYVAGSAKDGHNNSIPDTTQAFSGGGYAEYNFVGPPASDLTNFLQHAQNHGITISGGGGGRIACTSAGGGTPYCEVIPY